ncbi:MAG TPA: hydrogenase 4 subunit F [Candidatus Limnocylindrales bacterium]|jgi:hydrogenase-4 component F|nr:hydrogenase 4 subunit F [Candidatus Limnocylindrales bacterium]
MILILLVLIPFLTGLLCLLINSRLWWERANLLAFGIVAVLSILVGMDVSKEGKVVALGGFLRADSLSTLVLGLTAFVALVCGIYAVGYFRRDLDTGRITQAQLRHYYVLAPIFVSAMLLAPLADNLGVMWVAIESTTLASVLLVTFYNQKTSFEAGWKYIIIGSVGISLALFGTVITYSSAVEVLGEHPHQGMNWSALIEIADKLNPTAMRLAFVMVLLGYGTKAGLAPMHTWKPDAYSEAPVPAATLLGAGFINCAIYAIMRFDVLAEKCLGHGFPSVMLIGFGVFSILLAAPFVLVQRNFRRLLAYSSIDHAGIMVAALGFGGKLGALGAVLHMLFHAVTKPLLFFTTGNIEQHFGTPYFRKVRGVIHTLPWTAGLLLVSTLAVTGTPPFSIFQSEFTALSGALDGNHPWAAALFIVGVVTIFVGFLVHMANMNLGAAAEPNSPGRECPWKMTAMILVACVIIALGIFLPRPIYGLLQDSAHLLSGSL